MRVLLISYFLLTSVSFANETCGKMLSIEGFSTELKTYKMDISFCPIKKSDKAVILHVNYLNKDTKTVYLSLNKYESIEASVKKLKNELKQKKWPEVAKCEHSSRLKFDDFESGDFELCERSEDHLLIKKSQEIIREVYYSN